MPFRRTRPKADAEGYYPVATLAELADGRLVTAQVEDKRLVLTRLGDQIVAVGRYCPHAAGDFANGKRVRHKLICPEHSYIFDLRDGRILWPEDEIYCLKRFDVRIRDGMVLVRVKQSR